ncbi:MAG TPA: hypothetical protein VFX56_07405, partial [Nitrospira sp.]|nr:hypothetical protein [Nitrospira sp.]
MDQQIPNPAKRVWVDKTEEKGSDVNLATHLLHDGFKGLFDIFAKAILSLVNSLTHLPIKKELFTNQQIGNQTLPVPSRS